MDSGETAEEGNQHVREEGVERGIDGGGTEGGIDWSEMTGESWYREWEVGKQGREEETTGQRGRGVSGMAPGE